MVGPEAVFGVGNINLFHKSVTILVVSKHGELAITCWPEDIEKA